MSVLTQYLALKNIVLLFDSTEVFPVLRLHLLQSQEKLSLLLGQVSLLLGKKEISLLVGQVISFLVGQSLDHRALLNLQRARVWKNGGDQDFNFFCKNVAFLKTNHILCASKDNTTFLHYIYSADTFVPSDLQ